MRFLDNDKKREGKRTEIQEKIENFVNLFQPLEDDLIVMTDFFTKAYYIEVHILAQKMIGLGTIDVPLDPEEQSEYRANREVVEDHDAFLRMQEDAINGRTFSNIVAEFNTAFNEDKPLKIIGGQHRFIAIREALEKDIDHYHGIKLYFGLNIEQRLDVQLISNTNIAVASDLLDRMFETLKGPELRNWCQSTGLLLEGQDFSDKKQRTSHITVRLARTFIMSYIEGRKNKKKNYDKVNPTPIIAKTGSVDEAWETIRTNEKDLWSDTKILEAARQFAKLHLKQKEFFERKKKNTLEFAYKAFNYSVLSSWAYIAGILEENEVRLKRHFELSMAEGGDPLNASALQKGRHKTDPDNYRGLGTRTDKKELGRLSELFFLQAEKGSGLNAALVDLAIKKYHAKLATLEVQEAEQKIA
jgi:hypothetical protein